MTPTQNADRAALLDAAAVHARAAQIAAHRARVVAAYDAATAQSQAGEAADAATRTLAVLCDLGAAEPPIQPGGSVPAASLSLAALATMDTPDMRELLHHLEQAQAVAERVDESRGHVLPPHIELSPGESRGTNHAETVSEIAGAVRAEIFGRTGKD